ncbi:MAG TPA: CvpA family protein, partial [bacterium]|nr:CvpA family protein [bacterium]
MSTFDIIALIIIAAPGVRSMLRGFVKEAFSLGGIVVGLIAARLFHTQAAAFFKGWIKQDLFANALGYVSIYLAINVAAEVISFFLSKILKKAQLGAVDRLGGFAVGALKGLFVVGLFVMLVNGIAGSIDKSFLSGSLLARPILGFMKIITGVVITKTAA